MREKEKKTYQLAVETTGVAVELVVEAAAPQRRVRSTAVRALGFDASRRRVGVRRLLSTDGRRTRARRARPVLRAEAERRTLAVDERRAWRRRAWAQTGRRDGAGDQVLDYGLLFDAAVGCQQSVVVSHLLRVAVLVRRRLHLDFVRSAERFVLTGVHGAKGSRRPASGAVCVEDLVEREFDGGTRDAESVGVDVPVGVQALAVGHDVREGWCRIQ